MNTRNLEAHVPKRNSVFNRYPLSCTFEKQASFVSLFKNSLSYMLSQYYLQEQFNCEIKR